MKNYRYRSTLFLSPIFLAITLLAIPSIAQNEENPNSPTPVLLSTTGSSRALATDATKPVNVVPTASTSNFPLNGKAAVFVTNVRLMKGEDYTAFRVYAEDGLRHLYRFPVVGLKIADKENQIYAITFELRDELGVWEVPASGDIFVSVAWRGLQSNRLALRIGKSSDSGDPLKGSSQYKDAQIAPENVGDRYSGDRVRFLEQATFGPSPALDLRVRRIGIKSWLNEQFEIPYPSSGTPYPNFPLRPTTLPLTCNGQIDNGEPDPDPFCYPNNYTQYPVQNWFYREAFYGDAQLRHRVAWALGQLWVISGTDIQQSSHMVAYHKILSRNAFGNWRTLMKEMTLSPGMGDYLDMRESTRFYFNENFAREVLQLFNIGLVMLNPDGTVQTDQQNNPIPTYDQRVVGNFTSLLTGWNNCEASLALCPNRSPGSPNFIDPMIITNTNNHDLSAKTLLAYPGSTTTNVPACEGCTGTAVTTYANNSLNQALDNIYNHPNVAPFISKFLIEQLVTGDPTPAYVGRISAVFNANRTNPSQLKEVVKAILLDPEARGNVKTEPRYGKLREPVLLLTNLARQFDARSFDRTEQSDGVLTAETSPMGQVAFMQPSVFNFYPPQYIVPGTSFNGPEYALYTTGTAVSRINFINTLVFNGVPVNAERRVTVGTSLGLADLQSIIAADPGGNDLMDVLNIRLMHGTMSDQMRATILNAVLTVPASDPLLRAKRAVYLVATSSQYQVQR
ncbi:MAG: hypothetical protein DMF63_00020 [Acidobacteria bacterium]|nr:MAG: hypothetical protein DMF63_00020 [Acidobacteriota bacterium]